MKEKKKKNNKTKEKNKKTNINQKTKKLMYINVYTRIQIVIYILCIKHVCSFAENKYIVNK